MKRLIPLLLIVCLFLCACQNKTPTVKPNMTESSPAQTNTVTTDTNTPNDDTPPVENTVSEESEAGYSTHEVTVPADLQCVCYDNADYTKFKVLPYKQSAELYAKLMGAIPGRNSSNPAYQCEGKSFLVVFYEGPEFTGNWDSTYTYHATLIVAENGVVSQCKTPFDTTTLNFNISPVLYTTVSDFYSAP